MSTIEGSQFHGQAMVAGEPISTKLLEQHWRPLLGRAVRIIKGPKKGRIGVVGTINLKISIHETTFSMRVCLEQGRRESFDFDSDQVQLLPEKEPSSRPVKPDRKDVNIVSCELDADERYIAAEGQHSLAAFATVLTGATTNSEPWEVATKKGNTVFGKIRDAWVFNGRLHFNLVVTKKFKKRVFKLEELRCSRTTV